MRRNATSNCQRSSSIASYRFTRLRAVHDAEGSDARPPVWRRALELLAYGSRDVEIETCSKSQSRSMNFRIATPLLLGAVGLAVIGMYVVRRRAPVGGFFNDTGRAGDVFGVIGTAFAVLLAFIIFLAFESYQNARELARQEADAVREHYATTSFLSPPVRDELRGQLICYSRAVIDDEWPAMKHERRSALVDGWVSRLETTVFQFDPTDANDSIALSHWVETDALRKAARRGRIAEAAPFVPPPLLIILVFGGVIVLVYMLSFADRGERFIAQALMIGAVTAIFVSSMLVVDFLDHPYENTSGSIKPVEITRTLQVIEGDQERSRPPEQRVAVPCDGRGKSNAPR